MSKFIRYLFPQQLSLTHKERLLSGLAGLCAVAVTTWLSVHVAGEHVFPFMLASMGASTVLLLGAPHSPLSQPWPFVGGQLISGFIGITCAMWIPNIPIAAGMAVGLSLIAMYYLRCLHPPGGATTLLAVIGDQRIHALGYHLLLSPVLINIAILLSVALVINRLLPDRRYPMTAAAPGSHNTKLSSRVPVKLGFSEEDLANAMRDMNAFIDVTRDDLEQIYALATLHSHKRRVNDIRLEDIMTRTVVTVTPQDTLKALWAALRHNNIRGVPVIDGSGKVIGVVSLVDFMKLPNWCFCAGLLERIRGLFKRASSPIVEQIMSSPAITAPASMGMLEAFMIFSKHGINHLPVVDTEGRPVGIVTRLDLLSAIYGDMAA